MNAHPGRRRMLISYAAYYLVFASVAARAVFTQRADPTFGFMLALLAFYLLLLIIQPWLLSRSVSFLHVTNALQLVTGLALLLYAGQFDSFSMLFIPLGGQSIQLLPRKTALAWIAAILLLNVAVLLIHFPLNESIGYIIVYPSAMFLIAGFCYLAMQAEEAQQRSEVLTADLQKANQKLQVYSAQVQELAAADERNRLARELHDSVTQIIFGLTLSAQAARILINRDPVRAAGELDHIQTLAQDALAEMRALIQQLHPHPVAPLGLAAGLRQLAAERGAKDGLIVDLQIRGERSLPEKVEEALFRFAQEALNNIVKHAHTDHAMVALDLEDAQRVTMRIEDAGVGFDTARARSMPGHLGLTSMSERIQALGGTLVIDSKPGRGTRLNVELALEQEVQHA